ncbi:MAG: mevalonate kinase [archaeon YNP-WB-062]|jgi:mevalonate kinase|nr:mevalonate kinase [Candidatus Culexarchaeum yellowstonense]
MVIASAPAKVILFGEHFVVEDKLAIAAAINLRAKVSADFNDSNFISISSDINSPNPIRIPTNMIISGDFHSYNSSITPLLMILHVFSSKHHLLDRGIDISIKSEIPMGAGLGSSAAVFVAFSAAILKLYNVKFNPYDVIELASKGESLAHGKPSGIDTTISAFGGILLYRRSQGFNQLNVKFNAPIILGITTEHRSTADMVNKVLKLKYKYPSIFNLIYDANDKIVEEAVNALLYGDINRLGELLNISHGLLSSLGISTLNLERLIYAARNAGAYGAKITGAGGGGAIIAISNESTVSSISKAINDNGGKAIISYISDYGVNVGECSN